MAARLIKLGSGKQLAFLFSQVGSETFILEVRWILIIHLPSWYSHAPRRFLMVPENRKQTTMSQFLLLTAKQDLKLHTMKGVHVKISSSMNMMLKP